MPQLMLSIILVTFIQRAKTVMEQFNHTILDNERFYQIDINDTSNIDKKKVRFDTSKLKPLNIRSTIKPIEINIRPSTLSPRPPTFTYDFVFTQPDIYDIYRNRNRNGEIDLMISDKNKLIHIIRKSNKDTYYNETTNELIIRGYSTFIIDDVQTYRDTRNKKYFIFKSRNNFIHIKKSSIVFDTEKKDYSIKNNEHSYTITTIDKTKMDPVSLTPYLLIEQVVFKKF